MKFLLAAAAMGGVLLQISGCAEQPARLPDTQAPPAFEHAYAPSDAVPPAADWYRRFNAVELVALVQEARAANLDLAMARSRVLQANASARAAGAAFLPEIGAEGSAIRYSGHSGQGTAKETDWSALLSASYEIDFWGRRRLAVESSKWQLQASEADRATVALTVTAAIADTYFSVLSLRERIRAAAADADAMQHILNAMEARHTSGLVGSVELASQRAATANAQLLVPQLREQEASALGALAVLTGRNPEGFQVSGQSLDGISEPEVAAGIPSQLLTARPDLMAAEASLRAAHADVGVARAALLPSITLTANGGLQNPAMQAALITLPGAGGALALGATLQQTLFDNGRRRALRDLASAREAELVSGYRAAVLAGFLDVESVLAARARLEEQRPLMASLLEQTERAADGALQRYEAGSGDFLVMLDARRNLLSARDQASQYRLERLRSVVSLCRALGGGWHVDAVAGGATP